ncbi:MAG: SCP2 sterol-binding domain-containing protein [Burkholderiales bacterium]|nr:MAG: SCP2 sterol-binding domain-containing protein [Burkholderiales bacterium]
MLDQIASSAAAAVLNHMLAREPWARERLAPFAGRSARLQAPPLSVQLGIAADGSFTAEAGSPTVTIGVDAAALPRALLEPKAALRNVRLDGDAEFAQTLSGVLQRLRPEPEEELARFVGDAAAVRIVALLRSALAGAREAGGRLATQTADYLVAENPMLVSRQQMAAFAADVARLRDDVERLAKRIDLQAGRTP